MGIQRLANKRVDAIVTFGRTSPLGRDRAGDCLSPRR
jgi:hypothetical protein